MKKFVFITLLVLFPMLIHSQTLEEIQREAYPVLQQTSDNSDIAKLLWKITEAKKQGNKFDFNRYLTELKTKYSGKGIVSESDRLPENRNYFYPLLKQPVELVNVPDWGSSVKIFNGNVGSSVPGNPNPFNRMLKIQTDTMGVLFVGFLSNTRDTLYYYRTTNKGLNWTMIQAIYSGSSYRYQSFDFAVTDTIGGFKIGMVVSLVTVGSNYDGAVHYADMKTDGTEFTPSAVFLPPSGRGVIGPVICTDGYSYSPDFTYWFVAAQNCDASTGVTSFVPCAYTPDWGLTWVHDTARSSYNDYELDIDYKGDTIYVLLTNNLTTTNENLRLRYLKLANWGTNVSWSQYNPAGESFPEFNGCLAVNRKTSAMVVTYTTNESSNNNIKYSYTADGNTWVAHNILSNQGNNETKSYVYSSPQQAGKFDVIFCSSGGTLDSIIYVNTTNITSGFTNRTIVTQSNLATNQIAPCVTSYMYNGTSEGVGVIYSGDGPTDVWYNGSDILTGWQKISVEIPSDFILSQNYPNPFNPITKISFDLPKDEYVTLKVYDMTGKEVGSLINGNLNAGKYKVVFDAKQLTSGIYFYRIMAGNFSDVKKMILIK